ncbi:MAG: hypothetical protein HUN04_01410 [Desulfobacter sp.]|nr:MAG: hypothetical protein HUN04_01410 [Desulfobacter sp.]
MVPIGHEEKNNVDQWVYAADDRSLQLVVENIKCDRRRCRGIFNNLLMYLNKEIGDKGGAFREVTETEIHAEITGVTMSRRVFAFVCPASIQIWTYSGASKTNDALGPFFYKIRAMADRFRYTNALAQGNVSMGLWGPQTYAYAATLLAGNEKRTALGVFKRLLSTSPFNYEAHVDFMEQTDDYQAAQSSAEIVFKNAEDSDLINRAAGFLNIPTGAGKEVPVLEKGEAGLQLLIIPLDPCSLLLLEEAGRIYEKITGIRTKICRLPEKWNWGRPDRIPFQRRIQEILVKMNKADIDFTGWAEQQYIDALVNGAASEDALSQYYLQDLIGQVRTGAGQFFADPHLDRFCRILSNYRSEDSRTMYVGVTSADIFSGDSNYVFSLGRTSGNSRASILSYHMMLSKTLSEAFQSRPRLAGRMAKELVPASLKQLGIPRSTDPSCPYSYSSGVSRLDQKTLNLSHGVTAALEKIMNQP